MSLQRGMTTRCPHCRPRNAKHRVMRHTTAPLIFESSSSDPQHFHASLLPISSDRDLASFGGVHSSLASSRWLNHPLLVVHIYPSHLILTLSLLSLTVTRFVSLVIRFLRSSHVTYLLESSASRSRLGPSCQQRCQCCGTSSPSIRPAVAIGTRCSKPRGGVAGRRICRERRPWKLLRKHQRRPEQPISMGRLAGLCGSVIWTKRGFE